MKFLIPLLLLSTSAFAQEKDLHDHSTLKGWMYDTACCSNRDCFPTEEVDIQSRGYMFRGNLVPFGDPKIRKSGDNNYHACIHPQRGFICLYVPLGGV